METDLERNFHRNSSMGCRTLFIVILTLKSLNGFLIINSNFLLEAMGKQGLLRLERRKWSGDQDIQTKYNATTIIEIVCPIAP